MRYFFLVFCSNGHKACSVTRSTFAQTKSLRSQGPVTREFWKADFDLAEIFDFKTFPRWLSVRQNHFPLDWVNAKIASAFA